MSYDVENLGTDLGQSNKCGWAKSVNGIPTLIIGFPTPTKIYGQQGQ